MFRLKMQIFYNLFNIVINSLFSPSRPTISWCPQTASCSTSYGCCNSWAWRLNWKQWTPTTFSIRGVASPSATRRLDWKPQWRSWRAGWLSCVGFSHTWTPTGPAASLATVSFVSIKWSVIEVFLFILYFSSQFHALLPFWVICWLTREQFVMLIKWKLFLRGHIPYFRRFTLQPCLIISLARCWQNCFRLISFSVSN